MTHHLRHHPLHHFTTHFTPTSPPPPTPPPYPITQVVRSRVCGIYRRLLRGLLCRSRLSVCSVSGGQPRPDTPVLDDECLQSHPAGRCPCHSAREPSAAPQCERALLCPVFLERTGTARSLNVGLVHWCWCCCACCWCHSTLFVLT